MRVFVSFCFVRVRAFHFLVRLCMCVFYLVSNVCVPFLYVLVFKHVRFIFDVRVCVCASFRVCVCFFVMCVCVGLLSSIPLIFIYREVITVMCDR